MTENIDSSIITDNSTSNDTNTEANAQTNTNPPNKKPVPKKSRSRKKTAPKTFEAAFHILKNNAATLQQQDEPNIDDLMTIVEESISAYKVCQTRINAVQQALDEAFADEDLAKSNDR